MKQILLSHKYAWLSAGFVLLAVTLACSALVPATQLPVATQPAVQAAPVLSQPVNPPQSETSPTVVASVLEEDKLLVDLYAHVNPAVVNITVYSRSGGLLTPQGQGSGFVYDGNGHIITNAHVVHGADYVEVTFSDNTIRAADVVGEDLHSDLAVVKVEAVPSGVTPLPLGDMESLAVGQTVVAIGNPFGLEGTLTRGVISALGRNIPALTIFSIPQAIQTDAAINPGNSGGPLLNLKGEVIGVNAQIETGGTTSSNLGVGFAIPVSIIRRVVPDLVEKGSHDWAWLGVRGGSLNPFLVKAMNLPVEKGAYIDEVTSGGPSDKAGLLGSSKSVVVDGRQIDIGGDVITAIDGQPVSSFDDILIYVALKTNPGQVVSLSILRNGKPMEIKVKLEKRPDTLNPLQSNP